MTACRTVDSATARRRPVTVITRSTAGIRAYWRVRLANRRAGSTARSGGLVACRLFSRKLTGWEWGHRMRTASIYLSRLLTDRAMLHLESLGYPYRVGAEDPPAREELIAGLSGAAAAVITLTEKVDADVLAAAGPGLRIIANVAVGYDNIDLPAAAAAGITVTNTPGVLDQASADHTFALILAATRRITEGDRLIRSGRPWIWGPRMLVGLDLSAGATLGILGYGRIGRAVARRALAFDMRVVATSRSATPGTVDDGVTFVDLPDLARRQRRGVGAHSAHEGHPAPDRRTSTPRDETHRLPDQHRARRRDRRDRRSSPPCARADFAAQPWTSTRANPTSTPCCSRHPVSFSPRTPPAPAKQPAMPWACWPWTTSPPCSPATHR